MDNLKPIISAFKRAKKPKRDYLLARYGYANITCHICRRWGTVATIKCCYLDIRHTVRYDKTVYIIPYHHTACKELLELNPLAYAQT